MSSKEQKFSRNRRFLPTGGRKFPRNDHFYASQRRRISRERPFLCQPKDGNSQEIANFMPAEGQIFREKGHFCASRRTNISRERPFFANRRTRISRKRPVLHQPEDGKNEPGGHFSSPGWEISTKIPPPKGRKSEKISGKTGNGATCSQTEPGFFHAARQMTSRKSRTAGTFLHRTARIFYVSLPGNVRSTRRKPTVPGRKTYGFHTGNIENREKKKGYPTDIFRIRNTEKKQTDRSQEKNRKAAYGKTGETV